VNNPSKKYNDVLGVDMGMSSVKIAWLHRPDNGPFETRATVVKPLPRDDSGGFVDGNKTFVASTIRSAVSEMNSPAKKVFLCISGPNIYIRRLSVIQMPEDELKKAIKFQLKDQIPFDLDMAVLDYYLVNQAKDANGAVFLNILAAAAEKKFIFDCISTMTEAGFIIEGITLAPFALAGAGLEKGPVAILDIGSFKAELTYFKDGEPQFSRMLPGSGSEFTKAMTGVLISDHGKLELTYEEAEKLKLEVGIPGDMSGTVRREISNAQLGSMLRPIIEKLAIETRRSVDYCKTQLEFSAPDKIYITGSGALLKNLDSVLAKETGLSVSFLSSRDSSAFDIAIAAGREEARHINIIPSEIKEQRVRKIQNASLRLVAFFSLAALLISYLYMTIQVKSLQGQIQIASANFNAMQEVVVLKDKIDKYNSMLAQLSQNQFDSYILLKVLSKSIPLSVELDSFSRRDNSEIDLKGTVSSNRPEEVLAEFTKTMEKTGVFKNIKIISMQKGAQGALWRFSMYCTVSLKQK